MNSAPSSELRDERGRVWPWAVLAVAGVALAGFFGWYFVCPCERVPGGWLLGEVHEAPVADWGFANQVPLCQLQIPGGLVAHSINLNCMAAEDGALYLSCSGCEGKYWSGRVGGGSPARLRLDGAVYPVTVRRVTDEASLDIAWAARHRKLFRLRNGADAVPPAPPPRADHWWSFQLQSAG